MKSDSLKSKSQKIEMNLNTLVIILGLVVSTAAQSVGFYVFIDGRFDQIENKQIQQDSHVQFQWRTFEEAKAWNQFKNLNPDLKLSIPDIQRIKKEYYE